MPERSFPLVDVHAHFPVENTTGRYDRRATLHPALATYAEERQARMRKLRRNVRAQSIYWWLDSFLNTAIGRKSDAFPIIEEFYAYEEESGVGESGSA